MYAYKESEIINELEGEEIIFIRTANININTSIDELNEQLQNLLKKEDSNGANVKIINNIINRFNTINIKKYYRVIFVEPNYSDGVILSGLSSIEDLKIGDEVLLITKNKDVEGTIKEIAYYKEENLPYPENVMYIVEKLMYRNDNKLGD